MGSGAHLRVVITRNRRMSRDYEFLAETTEALVYLSMIRLMLKRLAKGAV